MACIVGLSIENDGIGYSVIDSENYKLLDSGSTCYFDIPSNKKLLKENRYSEILTLSSINLLKEISQNHGVISNLNFCLLKTDILFQKEQESIKTEKKEISKILERIGKRPTYASILRFHLWEELGPDPNHRYCIYSGQKITMDNLFTDDFNIDHIIPRSYSQDNTRPNLIICSKEKNSEKDNNTPWEAWSHDVKEWNSILLRSKQLPINRFWRFSEQAADISYFVQERQYYINSPQRNFAGSFTYLSKKIGLIDTFQQISFINPAVHNIVKKHIARKGNNIKDSMVTNEQNAIVAGNTSQEAHRRILKTVKKFAKKDVKEQRVNCSISHLHSELWLNDSEYSLTSNTLIKESPSTDLMI